MTDNLTPTEREADRNAAQARAALAGREPSAAEVEAAADALVTAGPWPRPDEFVQQFAERVVAAALRAAAAVRAKQEASALSALKTHLADMMTVSDAALARAKAAEKRVKEYENSVKPERDALRAQVAAVRGIKTHNNKPVNPENLRGAATHEALCRSWIFDVLTGLADALTDADSALRGVRAEAWDEGARRCDQAWHDGDAISVFDRNPYREQGEA